MQACAKTNLFLKVLSKRQDGYHDIETLFWPLPWLFDDVNVALRKTGGISLECGTTALPCNEKNICWKAAATFMAATGQQLSPYISLVKRIPIAAGLGGGSSDAAAVLLQLRKLAMPSMSDAELAKIAASIGADVPFFLNPHPSMATGTGENLRPIQTRGEPALFLANPSFPIPAAWAYRNWLERCPKNQDACLDDMLAAIREGNWERIQLLVRNDLEHCIFHKFPVLGIIRKSMEQLGISNVHVSGSGPTLFGFSSDATAPDAAQRLQQEFDDFLHCFSTCAK